MKKIYGGTALLMAAITAVSLGVTAFTGTYRDKAHEEFSIVASFYPMYTAVLNLTEGVQDVRVSCLAQPQTGCLHDYQLSPDNMITLQQADLLVLNGAGAESFLDQALDQLPGLPTVDTSTGISLLESSSHHHHKTEEAQEEAEAETIYNEHIWMSPARYAAQVENLMEQLCAADPSRAEAYRANGEKYLETIRQRQVRLETAAVSLPFESCVIFHDSLAYLAEDLQLHVEGRVAMGEESVISAGELEEIADAIRGKRTLFLYDNQYPVAYTYLTGYAAGSYTAVLDAAVTPAEGTADKDRWVQAMDYNLSLLEQAGAGSGPSGEP